MVRVKLHKTNKWDYLDRIMVCDGEVLEIFDGGNDKTFRYHLGQIQDIRVDADNKGNHVLKAMYNPDVTLFTQKIDQEDLSKVNELVAEVQKAMASLTF